MLKLYYDVSLEAYVNNKVILFQQHESLLFPLNMLHFFVKILN